MKWIVRGDFDGFFGLALNNFVNLLLLTFLCRVELGFSDELVFGRILPGMALGLLFGNLFYAWQAKRLAKRENRQDVCALPYGINLLTILTYTFFVMRPVALEARAEGLSPEEVERIAWQVGLMAGVCSGLIELFGTFVVYRLQRVAPQGAFLAGLAGIGLLLIAPDYLFRSYTYPLLGLTTFAIMLCVYYGGLRLPYNLPGGLLILTVGTVIAWLLSAVGMPTPVNPGASLSAENLGGYLPLPALEENLAGFAYFLKYSPIIIPMGLVNVIGSLQSIESAAAAGDRYPSRSSLAVNGLGSIVGAGFGSPFPTTLFIGHPGFKEIGARAGYSLLNGGVLALICLTGSLSVIGFFVPVEAGMAILIWIGITICSQAFAVVPKHHIPAVAVGLLPVIGTFGALLTKDAVRGAGFGGGESAFSSELFFEGNRITFLEGVFALDAGFLYTSIILTAATICIIEQQFYRSAIWIVVGAVFALLGLSHSFEIRPADVTGSFLTPGWKWVFGYLAMAGTLALVGWIKQKGGGFRPVPTGAGVGDDGQVAEPSPGVEPPPDGLNAEVAAATEARSASSPAQIRPSGAGGTPLVSATETDPPEDSPSVEPPKPTFGLKPPSSAETDSGGSDPKTT
ncbi:MAG: NCS2 family permease [Opitutales bacterium]